MDYKDLEDLVRSNMRENLYLLGLNFTGKPRTKEFYPAGFMRKMGIMGIYFPFTGESYIDPAIHVLEKPITVAHEMAHSYGVTNEGEANFIGWVICSNSDDPLLQYSGQLRLLRYQMNDLYRMSKELYTHFYKTTYLYTFYEIYAHIYLISLHIHLVYNYQYRLYISHLPIYLLF